MNNKYKTTSHAKHLLQFHVIFVCKFRYKFLQNEKIDIFIKNKLIETAERNKCQIHFIESDKDHIHILSESQNMIANGWLQVYDCGTIKMEYHKT